MRSNSRVQARKLSRVLGFGVRFNACLTKLWHCRWAKCSSTEPFTKQQCECAVPLAPRTAGRTTRLGSPQHTWKLPPQATKETHQVTTRFVMGGVAWQPNNTRARVWGVLQCMPYQIMALRAKCSNTEPFTKQQCECVVPLAPRTPFQNSLQQLQRLTHDERLAYLQQITPAKVREYRLSRPTLFSQYLECTNTVKATGMTGTVSVVIIGKDSRFLHYGSEAEARFNVSLTRAKALTVVLAPPSATGPLGMPQTASIRLFGRLDMASLQKSAQPVATFLGEDLDEPSWHGAHHISHAAPWKELPLALSLKMRDTEEPLLLAPLGRARPEK